MDTENGIGYIYAQVTIGIPYRLTMRFMHKFGWHYAPKNTAFMDRKIGELTKKEVRTYHVWCKWCGLRGDVSEYD